MAMRCDARCGPSVWCYISPRACYAMPGTDITRSYARAMRCPVLKWRMQEIIRSTEHNAAVLPPLLCTGIPSQWVYYSHFVLR
eukprot:3933502-Rhodomonas_salina.1